METTLNFLLNVFTVFGWYSVFCSIIFIVSLWKIFIKENIPAYYSLIPFLNLYHYFKLCSLPFWLVFIPFANVVCLYCSAYVITKKYQCKRWQSILAIFFPFVFLPYIAFSNKRNIDFVVNNTYIKNISDIDNLEKKLANDQYIESEANIESGLVNKNNIDAPFVSEQMKLIEQIENSVSFDEYVFDDFEKSSEQEVALSPVEEFDNNTFIEIDDDISINNLSLENVDNLEKKIIVENSVEKRIETDIKEYTSTLPSDEAIAFGGKRKIENVDSVKTKNDQLRCARCGSSLVGANGFCPGCGTEI